FFRRDVYIKGQVPHDPGAMNAYLDATPFGTLFSEDKLQREVRLAHYTLRYQGEIFDALIPALVAEAATVGQLATLPGLAGFGVEKIRGAILPLLLGGQIVPMARSAGAVTAVTKASAGRLCVPLQYNRMILTQRLADRNPTILASPPAGTGFVVPMLEALGIRVLSEVEPGDRAAWIRRFVARQPVRLQVAGQAVEGTEAQAQIIEAEIALLAQKRVPKLLSLGVLANQ
ncbi:MAG: hypothetical protein ABI193_24425, partial [Minicystis sp.]